MRVDPGDVESLRVKDVKWAIRNNKREMIMQRGMCSKAFLEGAPRILYLSAHRYEWSHIAPDMVLQTEDR